MTSPNLEPSATPAATSTAEPRQPVQIKVDPARAQVFTGETGSTRLKTEAAGALAGIAIRLIFDPQFIAVVDAEPETPGVQVAIDPLLLEQGASVAINQADNEIGIIEIKLDQLHSSATAYGLGTVTWLGLNEGMTELVLAKVALTDGQGQSIDHQTQPGVIQVMASGKPIRGRVLLQGRRQHGQAKVFVWQKSCPSLFQEDIRQAVPVASTNDGGNFTAIPGTNQTIRCLRVVQPGYLIGQRELPQNDIGTITLPGGDVNGDNVVDIFDMAYIGSRYGDDDLMGDINGDGAVTIFDLVLAASNYGRRGPVTDWQ